jgi:hypothetical protein
MCQLLGAGSSRNCASWKEEVKIATEQERELETPFFCAQIVDRICHFQQVDSEAIDALTD